MYQPFYCKYCHVDCNSSVMLEAHLSGKSHKKKLKQLGIEDFAGDMETSSKGKILTLEQKLVQEKHGEPVIGLDQIIVIKPRSNFGKSYEPKYRCELCDVTAEIDPIYQHLVGHRHRKAYLEEILGKKGIDLKEDSKRYARKWDDKNPKQLRYIESNSQYEAVMPSTQVDKERLEGKGISMSTKIEVGVEDILLEALTNAKCKNEVDAKLCYDNAFPLVNKLAEFQSENAENPRKEMEEWDEILNKITQKYNKATQAAMTKRVFKEEGFKKEDSKKSKDVNHDEINTRSEKIHQRRDAEQDYSKELEKFRQRIIEEKQYSKKSQDANMKNSKSEKKNNSSSSSNYYYPYMKKEPSDK